MCVYGKLHISDTVIKCYIAIYLFASYFGYKGKLCI